MPLLRFLLAQIAAWALVLGAVRLGAPLSGLVLALVQGALAALIAPWLRAEPWWRWVHLAFTPAVWLASQAAIAPGWYLAGLLVLAIFYWTSFRTRVPLFLSNRRTVAALDALLPPGAIRFLDAGAGTGSALRPLARAHPHSHFVGIEAAPAPWLIGWLMSRAQANVEWRRGNFWAHDWSGYDLVYVFLSPVPMPEVWAKACRDMRPGALLVSNSFAVPGIEPVRVIEPDAAGRRPLFVYAPAADTGSQ